ncbi:MAG: hypothetical protein MI976_21625 [Pseudomonadales bacterium]|nr:hypothetical protein [Pseudomonadales bacterium]
MFRAHKLEGIDQAQRIRKDLAAIAKQHLVFVGVAFCSIAAGLLAFSWEGYQSGEEKLIYIALPMLLMMPIMLITPLRQKRYYSQIKSEVTKTDLVITPMQLFELYNTKNKNDQKK